MAWQQSPSVEHLSETGGEVWIVLSWNIKYLEGYSNTFRIDGTSTNSNVSFYGGSWVHHLWGKWCFLFSQNYCTWSSDPWFFPCLRVTVAGGLEARVVLARSSSWSAESSFTCGSKGTTDTYPWNSKYLLRSFEGLEVQLASEMVLGASGLLYPDFRIQVMNT